MATHDYVIANGTGAAVRSDLNNALAAIVSNNSSSTEPGTTYAYQWWADTNANVLKIRNSANDGWITLRELDGTMLIEDGSAASPGLAFADDTNTGIYSGANNQIGFTTDGVERFKIQTAEAVFNDPSNDVDFRVESNGNTHMLFVDAGNDRVGIGTSSAASILHTSGSSDQTVTIQTTTSGADSRINFRNNGGVDAGGIHYKHNGNHLTFLTGGGSVAEQARIDSSGRLLVGTSTASSAGNSQYSKIEVSGNTSSATGPGHMTIKAGEAASTMSDDDTVGRLMFSSLTGGDFAHIQASIDGSPSGSDFPGRLMFHTTADSASSPTERLRISSNGAVSIGTTSNSNRLRIHEGADTPNVVIVTGADESSEFLALGVGSGNASVTAGGVSSTSAALVFRTADNGTETEKARLDGDGRLLVGTTSVLISGAEKKLQMTHAGAGAEIVLGRDDSSVTAGNALGAIKFVGNDGGTYQQCAKIEAIADGTHQNNDKSTRLVFSTTEGGNSSPTERMRIDNNGITYINTTSNPGSARLSIGENFTSRNGLSIKNTGAQGGGQYYALFYNNAESLAGSISHNGSTSVAFNTSSDYRLKENITSVVDGITRLQQLKPSRFNFIADPNKTVDGFIAHEVQTVIPEAITGDKDAVDDEGNPIYQGIDQSKLVPLLTAALQEAIAKIETLEAKVAALEAG
jgi:hypothetical protein